MKRFTFSVPQNILFGEGVLKGASRGSREAWRKTWLYHFRPHTEQTWRSGAV